MPLTLLEPAPDADPRFVPEALVHDIWANRLYDPRRLTTTDGKRVTVVDPGRQNADSGPDFLTARLQIDSEPIEWVGDVEIHTTSDQWNRHGHDDDPAYRGVVLHVSLASDVNSGRLTRADGSRVPEVVLLPALDRSVRHLLYEHVSTHNSIPRCARRWESCATTLKKSWVTQLGKNRMLAKARRLRCDMASRNITLDRMLGERIFRALGYAHNAEPMQTLFQRLPLARLSALDDCCDCLAVLLGMGGLLTEDMFPRELWTRFLRYRKAWALEPKDNLGWRRGGRPANSPYRRLEQAAILLPSPLFKGEAIPALLRGLNRKDPVAHFVQMLRPEHEDCSPMGRQRALRVIINAFVPVLLIAADVADDASIRDATWVLVARLREGTDGQIRPYLDLGFRPDHAIEVQGLRELREAFCEPGYCARCAIGRAVYPGLRAAKDAAIHTARETSWRTASFR